MMDDDDSGSDDSDNENYDDDERCLQLITVLKRKKEYPKRTRKKINQLVDNFLNEVEFDVHAMFCDNDSNAHEYRGLDSSRDTKDEVEAIVRSFPEVLSRRKEFIWDGEDERWVENGDDRDRDYPIHYLTLLENGLCNVKAISFVPLVVRLSIEFGWLNEDARGGLLIENGRGNNILQLLTHNDIPLNVICEGQSRYHHELIDNKNLLVMKQLRQMGYLKKEDIQNYGLLNILCIKSYYNIFAEKRFKFFAEWDPTLLIHNGRHGLLPLYCAANSGSIQAFQTVFEYGLLYYPIKKGISLLFTKSPLNRTPIQILCKRYGSEKVMEVVEDTLIQYTSSSSSSLNLDHATPHLNIVDALLSAAIDEYVHLDCVYFLTRRHPDILMKLLPQLSSGMSSTTVVLASKNDDDANGNSNSNSTSKNDDEISSRSNINNYRDDMNDGRSNSSSDNDDSSGSSSNLNDNFLVAATTTAHPKKRKRKQKDNNK
ncbi:hypothetical protein FRACYDRAFT_257327 [Fragilariopsis cylindrus CCMP1102]|uniref:Ankyrin n=1 Tax=Fragilariopsis cylindrus CCMP1102 TaxID=635003 RepID=A0A1E7EK66_9STRA|nr:hypothetical protein FRACYDRAFT_257327 [Fragilariopsis cylindrus CCMP1102]|eukprot:OEU05943.1 hypothetical protein FRACYDRAFT_257327 [Fragilariopsis cylindrus CCMP1102]